jgi:hypothetical protein
VRRGERRWQVDGTPTDCVMLAVRCRGDGGARVRHSLDRDLVRGG